MLDNKWLTIAEASDVIGCSDSYVRFLLRENQISGKKVTDRLWLVDVASAKKFAKTPQKTGRPRGISKNP